MLNQANADSTAALCHSAVEQAGDVQAGCLTLIVAAMACQHMLRGVMSEAKVEDMINVLSVAGALLLDDECDGLLHAANVAGSA